MERKQLAGMLAEAALLLELSGANQFKTRAFSNAARTLRGAELAESELTDPDRLRSLKGIGSSLAESIAEAAATGKMAVVEELKAALPPGLAELTRVPGLGAKRARRLYEELDITSLGELAYACQENRLISLSGFGPKTQAKILEGLEFLKRYQDHFLYPDGLRAAQEAIDFLEQAPQTLAVRVVGQLRRRTEIIDQVGLVATATAPSAVLTHFSAYIKGIEMTAEDERAIIIKHPEGPSIRVRATVPKWLGAALVWETGSEAHLEELAELAAGKGLTFNDRGLFDQDGPLPVETEESLYRVLGLAYIPPELREGQGEIRAAIRGELPRLVEPEDLRGLFHVHTTASDGAYSLKEMALRARELGYSYLALSDHSRSAVYAGGLSAEALQAQAEEVALVNRTVAPFRVFHGVESDILTDGSLDYPNEVLDRLDFVIASVHSGFTLSREDQTARLIKAVSHPATTILGHPTGRLLLARKPYEVDLEAVIKACAEHGTALEINANAHRLDTDWRVAKEARLLGVKFALGPDAHNLDGLADIDLGLGIGRKAWLEPRDVLNCLGVEELAGYLAEVKGEPR